MAFGYQDTPCRATGFSLRRSLAPEGVVTHGWRWSRHAAARGQMDDHEEGRAVRLHEALEALGAVQLQYDADGPFSTTLYEVDPLVVEVRSEYGTSRANVGVTHASMYPASFWLAALAGRENVPDPVARDSDVEHLGLRLREILDRCEDLVPKVETMGRRYRERMRARFS